MMILFTPHSFRRSLLPAALLLTLATVLTGCAINPATGKRQISLVSEAQEIAMGEEADPAISASYGLYDDPLLQKYIDDLGQSLAEVSERPQLPWTFRLVDDPTVNAFAVPGGFIYITRGIMASLNSEAELVGVMGHEVGHITARHSVNQITRQQLSQIGMGVGMIVSSEFRRHGEAIMQGVQMMNLSYNRGDESQSDALGVRYMTRLDYDPNALIGVMKTLGIVSGGSGRLPEWQLTHPYPENREAELKRIIAESPVDYSGYQVNRNAYLLRMDGMTYGINPREGYFKDGLFHHPDMAFRLAFPRGWETVNQKTMVGAINPEQNAMMLLTLDPESDSVEAAMTAFTGQEGIQVGTPRTRRSTVFPPGSPSSRPRVTGRRWTAWSSSSRTAATSTS